MSDQEIAATPTDRDHFLFCAYIALWPLFVFGVFATGLTIGHHRQEVATHFSQTLYLQVPDTNSSMCRFGGQALDGSQFFERGHEIKASRCWEPI